MLSEELLTQDKHLLQKKVIFWRSRFYMILTGLDVSSQTARLMTTVTNSSYRWVSEMYAFIRKRYHSWYGLDNWGISSNPGSGNSLFSSLKKPDEFWSPPSLLYSWILWAASHAVKWLVCEVDHAPPESEKLRVCLYNWLGHFTHGS
jgi:hypothetical protein